MSYTAMQWKAVVQNSVLSPLLSPNIDLGRPYDYLQVYIPVINTGPLTLEVSHDNTNTTFYKLSTSNAVSATAGNYHDVWVLGGHQFFRVMQYAAQNANKTWQFRGIAE